eukprot:TRINITY_DN2053_c0_g1_i1.p1 TRINITY_DN2053_c0_g1~~TRINITY_DN2053_c0_g1_i1.p1  ORF type:complete len:282 (+),score=42.77 TRINITY_DN2053_c0_g1_i1:664-1509(+)
MILVFGLLQQNGFTLLMRAINCGWDEDVIRAIVASTPPEYKNIQTENSKRTAVMYYLRGCKMGGVSFSLFKLLLEGVEETNMTLKDTYGNTVTFYALNYFQVIAPDTRLRLYDAATYTIRGPDTTGERMLVLSYLFERMTPEQRMSDVQEKVDRTRSIFGSSTAKRTTTYLMMLLGRVPVNIDKFANVFNLLLKDTTPEYRMKGNGNTTPAILACTFDCLMNEEIFDWLIKDMPQEYLENEPARNDLRGIFNAEGGLLETLLKSSLCNANKEAVIQKLIPL